MTAKNLLLGALALGCASSGFAQHPWAMPYADAARTQQSLFPGPNDDATLEWKFRLAGQVPGLAIADTGQITGGATFHDQWWSYEVFSSQITPEGKITWRKKMIPYEWGASQGIGAAPGLDSDGNIIMPSTKAQLYKLTSGGIVSWVIDGVENTTNDRQIAILPDGSVRWMQGGTIYNINPSGGTVWTQSSFGATFAVGANGDIYIEHGRITQPHYTTARTYLNADGSVRWTQTAYKGGTGKMPCMGPDNMIYLGGVARRPSDGGVVWQDPNPVGGVSNALGKNGRLYSIGSQTRAYNKDTGAILWTATLPGSPVMHCAIDSRDIIYAATDNGKVVALSPSGVVLWEKQICDRFVTGPAIGTDSRIVAVGKEGSRFMIYSVK